MGIEPTYQPWEGRILPMNYTRITETIISYSVENFNSLLTLLEKYPVPSAEFYTQQTVKNNPAAQQSPAAPENTPPDSVPESLQAFALCAAELPAGASASVQRRKIQIQPPQMQTYLFWQGKR